MSSTVIPFEGTLVNLLPLGETKEYFTATEGKALPDNFIQVENIFQGRNPPSKTLIYEIVVKNVQNPVSTKPAGDLKILTFFEEDLVDEGTSTGSFTPTPGNIEGRPIIVTNDFTNGKDSVYTLVFVP